MATCANTPQVLISALMAQLERSSDALGNRSAALTYNSVLACLIAGSSDATGNTGPTGATGATGA